MKLASTNTHQSIGPNIGATGPGGGGFTPPGADLDAGRGGESDGEVDDLADETDAGPGWVLTAAWRFLGLLMRMAQKPFVIGSENEPVVEGEYQIGRTSCRGRVEM